MSNHIIISAKFRDEPDYGKLARALLLFLDLEEESRESFDAGLEAPTGPTRPSTPEKATRPPEDSP